MHPHLFTVPVLIIAALGGAIIGSSVTAGASGKLAKIGGALGGGLLGLLIALWRGWTQNAVPVQGYGVMILLGFLTGVWLSARRAPRIGVEPRYCVDMGIVGVLAGLAGARIFHIAMHWDYYDPFRAAGFDAQRIFAMFKLWEGGLVFFGAFVAVIPAAWLYCRWHKIPPLKFLDLALPTVVAGQAFGRLGCFLNGCCFGKTTELPLRVFFPANSPAHDWQIAQGIIPPEAVCSAGVHPTQIYASVAAALTAAFLYRYWPSRKYDGQITCLTLIMVGSTRFFEELLRADEPPGIPALSSWLSIAQWISFALVLCGFALLLRFRQNQPDFAAQPQSIS